jgi:hypothetical protein
MTISITQTVLRSDASIPFFRDAPAHTIAANVTAQCDSYHSNSSVTSTITLSSDNLTSTQVLTFADLPTMSGYLTDVNLWLNNQYNLYGNASSFGYTLSGITNPFTCTVTFQFPSSQTALIEDLQNTLTTGFAPGNITTTDTSLTISNTFTNSDEFNAAKGQKMFRPSPTQLGSLVAAGAVRTILFQ